MHPGTLRRSAGTTVVTLVVMALALVLLLPAAGSAASRSHKPSAHGAKCRSARKAHRRPRACNARSKRPAAAAKPGRRAAPRPPKPSTSVPAGSTASGSTATAPAGGGPSTVGRPSSGGSASAGSGATGGNGTTGTGGSGATGATGGNGATGTGGGAAGGNGTTGAGGGTTGATASSLRIGLVANTQGWGTDLQQRQTEVASSGVRWIREELRWDVVEPQRGQWDFSWYDTVIGEAAKRGLTVLPLLMDTPAWAGPATSDIPADPTDYADYVAHVTARYGPGGSFWAAHPELPSHPATDFEIWNEPYFNFSSNNRVDPARYARLFKAAVVAGRAANPQAKFLMAATDDAYTYQSTWVNWAQAAHAAVPDLGQYVDGIAVHPYSKAYAPDTPFGSYSNDKFMRINVIRDNYRAEGIDKPFWITEIGWSTCSDATWCVSESNQATYTTRLFDIVRSQMSDWVQAVFLYDYDDVCDDNANPECRFGMLRRDHTPKPAWTALKAVTAAS